MFMKKFFSGLISGIANGLFGSGGGTVLIPLMQKYTDLEQHKAHATAIAVILPLCVISAFLYIRGVDIDWFSLLKVTAGGVAGGFVGAKLLNKISKKHLHIIFGICMLAAAVRGFLR
jgi:hypothetical protein